METNPFTEQTPLQREWNELGEKYATDVNAMVAFGEEFGWNDWKGEDPLDNREHLAAGIIWLLKQANKNGTQQEFREQYPPSYEPLLSYIREQGQYIGDISFIDINKIVFLTGAPYEKRQAHIIDGDKISQLEASLTSIGKSKRNNVFAFATDTEIVTTQGWEGTLINTFPRKETAKINITQLIPFNDGNKVLLVSSSGIFLITAHSQTLIHPKRNEEDREWMPDIDMENATLSNDNQYIVVGDQGSNHRVLKADLEEIGTIGPQSSYPHFCLFSANDVQLITNSCHFYNGITIGVPSNRLEGMAIEAYTESGFFQLIDDDMRVYNGVAAKDYYILGDAQGYIKAFNNEGICLWRHHLGSTVSGMAISDDGQYLFVGCYSGIIHKLKLDAGHRDKHTIGTGDLYEEFRMLIWKGEDQILKW